MRNARSSLVLAALGLAAAGCISPPASVPSVSDAPTAQLNLLGHGDAAPASLLEWTSPLLAYSPADERRCGPDNCEVTRFRVDPLPAGEWTLQVGLDWAKAHEATAADWDLDDPSFNATLRGPDGTRLFAPGAKYGLALHVQDPAPGEWELEARITHMARDWDLAFFVGPTPADPFPTPSSGSYTGRILLHPRVPPPAGPLLPDLLMRDLGQLRVEYAPPGAGNQYLLPSASDPTRPGCTVDEGQETGARRCLRFTVGVGNDGAGPFVVAAQPPADPAADAQGQIQEARMPAVQCVADGRGGTLRPAGNVSFSRSHGHLHYEGILGYRLFAYDWAAQQRGAEAATGAKLGYGPVGEGLVHAGRTPAAAWSLQVACPGMRDPVGLNAGWYDYYLWWRTSQYIGIDGVPDGTYELEAAFNPDGHILESNLANNAGSVAFRLAGDRVEVLRPFRFQE